MSHFQRRTFSVALSASHFRSATLPVALSASHFGKRDMDLHERLKAWRHSLGQTQEEFATSAGMSKASLIGYEVGQRKPGSDALAAIASTGVNMTWLLTGEGQMRPPQSGLHLEEPAPARVSAHDDSHARRWQHLQRLLADMPPEAAEALIDEFFARAQHETEMAELRQAVAELRAAAKRSA